MKIILSHDIDHLYWSEHLLRDSYIPKLFVRTGLQWFKNVIDTKTAIARINFLAQNRLHRIDELTQYLNSENIKSTFFIGFAKALNLSYSHKNALAIGKKLLNQGFMVGVHGIQYNNMKGILLEKARASPLLSQQQCAGIRMHYLRKSDNMYNLLAHARYNYDSTEYRIANPYKVKPHLWSFPIGVMDSYAINAQNESLQYAKSYTTHRIKEAQKLNIEYFVINTHDIYFDDYRYKVHKEWLIWIVNSMKDEGHIFVDYEMAIKDLENR